VRTPAPSAAMPVAEARNVRLSMSFTSPSTTFPVAG
jgi:hypothetical protein